MEDNKSMEVFAKAPIRKAVLQNALPAMAAMLMVLIYNLADTFFIGQTHDDLQVAAVSLATPVFLLFMSVGTVFGIGGTSVISRALGEGRKEYAKKVCSFCMWCCVAVGVLMSALFLIFMDQILALIGASAETWDYAAAYDYGVSFARILLCTSFLFGVFYVLINAQRAASPRRGDGIPDRQHFPSGADLHSGYVHPRHDLP